MTAARLHLSLSDLEAVCDLVYRETGMRFAPSKRDFIERRVADRLQAAGVDGVQAYLRALRGSADERAALVNAFTINETYFYREEHQFACLSRDLLPELAARRRPGDKIRIWSAPCSTGDEPYSIAIWLLENWPMVDAYNVEIIGSDIDGRALAAARQGVYGERALARLPAQVRHDYFEPADRGRKRIIQDLRESVTFTSVNLMDPLSVAALGRFDVVFCRNLLIYFDGPARVRAVANLFDALAPGGFLCPGHTESISRIDERFAPRRFPDAIVYQRPEAA